MEILTIILIIILIAIVADYIYLKYYLVKISSDNEKLIDTSEDDNKWEDMVIRINDHNRKEIKILQSKNASSEIPIRNQLNGDNPLKRSKLTANVRREVWQRDQGKCCKCGSNKKLEYDHIIPLSIGGSDTARNIQLLCEECNRKKSNKIE